MRGFTLVEIIVALAVVGIIGAIVIGFVGTSHETRLVACNADIMAMRTLVEQTREQTPGRRTPTREEVMRVADGRWNDDYWYVANNSDANSGHGNDLDFCDEENPGKSSKNRTCYDVEFVIVCRHDHALAGAGYVGIIDAPGLPIGPIVFSGDPDHKFVKDLTYWEDISSGRPPNLQKWIGK